MKYLNSNKNVHVFISAVFPFFLFFTLEGFILCKDKLEIVNL